MGELETRMSAVLLQLALTSNGRTASYNSAGGGERDYTPTLGDRDAPALFFERLWNAADSDDRRREVLRQAEDELGAIRHSSGDRTRVETKEERDRRIVAEGIGWEVNDVAVHFHCGPRDVIRAREAAGREPEKGYKRRDARELTVEERDTEILRQDHAGITARAIARGLQMSYSTVLRVLGRKA